MDTLTLSQNEQATLPEFDVSPSAMNVHVNEAMNDLLWACAIEWIFLPAPVWQAYTDRDHSKFDVGMWRFYLVGLMQAIRMNRDQTPRRVMVAYRRVRAVQKLSEAEVAS
jgi:hypothetical protein